MFTPPTPLATGLLGPVCAAQMEEGKPPPSFFHTLFYFPFLRTSERQKILEPEDEFESPGPHSGRKQTLNQKDEVSNLALGLQRFVTGNRGHLPSSVSLGS